MDSRIATSTEVRARIERSLASLIAPPGTTAADVERVAKHIGRKLWQQLRKRPSLGVALAGTLGLGLPAFVGVGELTFAAVAGYAAYQVLREGVSPGTVAKDIIEGKLR